MPEQTIGASYGDALMAAIGSGLVPADTDWTVPGEIVDRTRRPARSTTSSTQYSALYPATRPVVHALAEVQEGRA